ncbi:MAG: Hsp70 family protein [Gloeocapsa sp. DLM2.Bin57]|nr:MAG: Hsp70 family protein [Gloeocapsa sp. DLM2.Bin57]
MSGLKIGLDFGTTNSIISLLNSNQELETFQYDPLGNKDEYIPSFISYEDNEIEIGTAAKITALNNPAVESYANFKMRLPLEENDYLAYFAEGRTPSTVTKDYLEELLLSKNNIYSFLQQKGEIEGIVVSVPEIWQRDICNLGRERLKAIVQELGLPLIQLVSEPVAAAAYYSWLFNHSPQSKTTEPFYGNLLVCDMGGGTFDVSLCHLRQDNKVEVLYFDGEGNKSLDVAGVAFDRYCVQIAYSKLHDYTGDESSFEFKRLQREFETVKITQQDKIRKRLENYLESPEDFVDKVACTFGGIYSILCRDLVEAFLPIRQAIEKVINRVKAEIAKQSYSIDRILFVGGFSQFILVKKAVLSALNFDNCNCLEESLNLTQRAYAIAYGACLIANDLIDPVEKFIHKMGIVIDTINPENCQKEEKLIEIIGGDISLENLFRPQFPEIPPLVAFQPNQPLSITLWIEPQSQGKKFKYTLPDQIQLPCYSSRAKWRVGMRVDRSQLAYLIVEEVFQKQQVEYPLGNLTATLFPTFVLLE